MGHKGDKDREDDSGVFRKTLDETANMNRIANRLARAGLKPTGTRVVVVTKDIERARELRRLLADREVADSIGIATTASSAYDTIRERPPQLVVVETGMVDLIKSLDVKYLVLNGHDEETVQQAKREV